MTTELNKANNDMTEAQDSHPQPEHSASEAMDTDNGQAQQVADEMEVDVAAHQEGHQNDQRDDTQSGPLDDPSHNEVDSISTHGEKRPETDPDSLFVPERDPTPPSNFPQPHAQEATIDLTHVPVPLLDPAPIPKPPPKFGTSFLDKIQKKNKQFDENKRARTQAEGVKVNANPRGKQCHDDDEREHKKAEEEFQKKKRYYEELKKRNGGILPFAQDVEWLRIQRCETARQRKRATDIAMAQEGENGNAETSPVFQSTQVPEEEELSDTNFAQIHPPEEISMQDAELRSMRVALEALDDDPSQRRKKKEKGSADKGRSKPARTKREAAPRKVAKSSRQSKKKKKILDGAAKQASSLLYSNVFSQQAGADAPDQPFFNSGTRNKDEALKELIASVPRGDEKQARSDVSSLKQASREFRRGAVKPCAEGNTLWSVRGMKTPLKAYQILGCGFMRRRENSEEEPRGGLLADQMGLGKTLMTLANILDGRPLKNSTGPHATLIVASPALLTQWKKEIEQHTAIRLSIMRFGAGTRFESNEALQILSGHDIVLATYNEVMKSYQKNNPPSSCETYKQKEEWWKQRYLQDRGALHRIHFLRVVLDEAQAIKNHMSRTSVACRALQADHKWALSGTPIQNGLHELYPYFKFIGVPSADGNDNYDFHGFREFYCDPKNPEKLLVRLSQFMLRRTHEDEMFGAPILKLPQANQSTYWCQFNSVERCIYKIVHERIVERAIEIASGGAVKGYYYNYLVLLLRLRQMTAHILMLQFVIKDLLERRDIERIKEVVDRQAADSTVEGGKTIVAIRKQLEKLAEDEKKKKKKKRPENSGVSDDKVNEPDEDDFDEETAGTARRFGAGGKFGKNYNFKPFLNSLKTGESWKKAKETAKCGACGNRPRRPMVTSCGHLICSEPCYVEACFQSAGDGIENPPCKTCGETPQSVEACDSDDSDALNTRVTRSNARRNQNKFNQINREDIAEDWLASVGDDVLPSAKTIAVKSQIINWIKENPDVKIIVYTQFLAMVRILARVCQNEGWKVLQYHGKMNQQARDNAIRAFGEDRDARILLASLRCGGLGLNLTMASKVILIDPWWNSATEQQAFCRVFRIGQTEETYLSRLCVRGTVDEKLIEIQERKDKEIETVMREGGKPVEGMSTHRLIELFGITVNEDDDDDDS